MAVPPHTKNGQALIVSFDSNLLIYSFDNRTREKYEKANRILRVLDTRYGPLPAQVLREFLAVMHRKRIMPAIDARAIVMTLTKSYRIFSASVDDLVAASELAERLQLQFFDALICRVARQAGVSHLLSEDMQDGQDIDGLKVVNPFVPGNASLIEGLLA